MAVHTVELFGVPRLLAGQRTVSIETPAGTLGELAAHLARTCPALVGAVLDARTGWLLDGYTFAIDRRFTRDPATPLVERAAVLLVASAAGG